MVMLIRISFALLAAGLFAQSPAPQPSPDTIYYNGHVVTMWCDHPEVEAVAIRGDRFVAAGSNAEIRKLAAPTTREVDLAGPDGPARSAGQPHAPDRRRTERAGSSRAGYEFHSGPPCAHPQSV